MKSVVISGANGFIGSHLVNYFVEKGVSVVAIDLPGCNNHLTNHPLVQFFPCKMEDLDQFPQISPAPDVFYHLAWKGVSPQYRDDCATQNENISYCLNAVRLAARLGAQSSFFRVPPWNTCTLRARLTATPRLPRKTHMAPQKLPAAF